MTCGTEFGAKNMGTPEAEEWRLHHFSIHLCVYEDEQLGSITLFLGFDDVTFILSIGLWILIVSKRILREIVLINY